MRIIADFHGEEAARRTLEEFERVFARDGEPDDVPEFRVATVNGRVFLPKLLVECGLAKSNREAMPAHRAGEFTSTARRCLRHAGRCRPLQEDRSHQGRAASFRKGDVLVTGVTTSRRRDRSA